MIVVSKRCYLNILTQLMDRETLINANYYILDRQQPSRYAGFNDCLDIDEDGTLMVKQQSSSMGKYNVTYSSGELDPTPFMTTFLLEESANQNPTNAVYDAFIKFMHKPLIMLSTYQFIFKNKVQGNGLQFGIICDDKICRHFGHLICAFLSKNFGVDINYIDPRYRSNVMGREFYQGDKEFAKKTIMDLRDLEIIQCFKASLTQINYDESVNNLRAWLSYMDFPQLFHLYQLLFPDQPLPPNNYTKADLIEIVIGMSIDIMTQEHKESGNLCPTDIYTSEDWYDMLDRYERESNDFSQDDDSFI